MARGTLCRRGVTGLVVSSAGVARGECYTAWAVRGHGVDAGPVRFQEGVLPCVGFVDTRLDSLLATASCLPPILSEGIQLIKLLEGLLVEHAFRAGGPSRRVGVEVPANLVGLEEVAV